MVGEKKLLINNLMKHVSIKIELNLKFDLQKSYL